MDPETLRSNRGRRTAVRKEGQRADEGIQRGDDHEDLCDDAERTLGLLAAVELGPLLDVRLELDVPLLVSGQLLLRIRGGDVGHDELLGETR